MKADVYAVTVGHTDDAGEALVGVYGNLEAAREAAYAQVPDEYRPGMRNSVDPLEEPIFYEREKSGRFVDVQETTLKLPEAMCP